MFLMSLKWFMYVIESTTFHRHKALRDVNAYLSNQVHIEVSKTYCLEEKNDNEAIMVNFVSYH